MNLHISVFEQTATLPHHQKWIELKRV